MNSGMQNPANTLIETLQERIEVTDKYVESLKETISIQERMIATYKQMNASNAEFIAKQSALIKQLQSKILQFLADRAI